MQGAIPRGTAFQTLFPDFKISTGFKADSGMLTGICEIYKQRTDKENEYAIREIGVVLVPKGADPTNDMVNQAIKTAREAAISTLEQFLSVVAAAGLNESITAPTISPKRGNDEEQGAPVKTQSVSPIVPEKTESDETPPAEPVESGEQVLSGDDALPLNPVPDSPAQKDITASIADSITNGMGAAITKVPFSAELFPASTLVKQTASEQPVLSDEDQEDIQDAEAEAEDEANPEDELDAGDGGEQFINVGTEDSEDLAVKGVRDTVITILGKANDCNGWKAGKIVDEKPDVIINMFQRYGNGKYSGPKTDQMEAIEKLYPEALRRLQGLVA